VRDGVDFIEHMVDEWSHLEECVRDPAMYGDPHESWTAETWRMFEDGMRVFARLNVSEVVRKLDISASARRLLDLGGGHGLHCVELCRAHPGLDGVVYDVAQAEPSARRTIDGALMADRVKFRAGDFLVDDIGTHYDVVFAGNILHGYSPEENERLMKKVAAALTPGGSIAVLEEVPSRRFGNLGRAFASMMALNMYISRSTQVYAASDIARWLEHAGFGAPSVTRLVRTPGLALITATLQ
jgi:cyclopropane fatty-acyl-phospholipid synthase-like methyltransferase